MDFLIRSPVNLSGVTCVWCGEPLAFTTVQGWRHQDGRAYKTRIDADGVERNDHCALPNFQAVP